MDAAEHQQHARKFVSYFQNLNPDEVALAVAKHYSQLVGQQTPSLEEIDTLIAILEKPQIPAISPAYGGVGWWELLNHLEMLRDDVIGGRWRNDK